MLATETAFSYFFTYSSFSFIWTGACSDLALLPVVDLVWDGDGNGNGTVGWQRPATVRARASGAFAGSLPFTLSALPTVQANATRFAFPSTCVDAHAHTCNCTPFVLPLFFFLVFSPVAYTGRLAFVQVAAAFCPTRWSSTWSTAWVRSVSRVPSISRPPTALC